MKCCVYTRAFLETPYLNFFIEHYYNLGFDKIIILKADDLEYNLPVEYINFVEIHQVINIGNDLLPKYDYLVNDYDWIISIDVDEILLLNKQYKNIKDFIETKINNDSNTNMFYFRWGIIEKYDIDDNNNFFDVVNNYNIFNNYHIKSLFRAVRILNADLCDKKNLLCLAH